MALGAMSAADMIDMVKNVASLTMIKIVALNASSLTMRKLLQCYRLLRCFCSVRHSIMYAMEISQLLCQLHVVPSSAVN